jgi:hypothetical protein
MEDPPVLQLPEVDGHSALRLRSPSAHAKPIPAAISDRWRLRMPPLCGAPRMETRQWLWHPICLQNGEQAAAAHQPGQTLNGEPRLVAGEAADDGGRHGEID